MNALHSLSAGEQEPGPLDRRGRPADRTCGGNSACRPAPPSVGSPSGNQIQFVPVSAAVDVVAVEADPLGLPIGGASSPIDHFGHRAPIRSACHPCPTRGLSKNTRRAKRAACRRSGLGSNGPIRLGRCPTNRRFPLSSFAWRRGNENLIGGLALAALVGIQDPTQPRLGDVDALRVFKILASHSVDRHFAAAG